MVLACSPSTMLRIEQALKVLVRIGTARKDPVLGCPGESWPLPMNTVGVGGPLPGKGQSQALPTPLSSQTMPVLLPDLGA